MIDRVFFDTNILVYSIARRVERTEVADALLAQGGYVSVQVLNELTAIARRKLGMSWQEVSLALAANRTLCHSPLPIRVTTHESALGIGARYEYTIFDSLILASALEARCTTLYSEDHQSGQTIDDQLTIRNPFWT